MESKMQIGEYLGRCYYCDCNVFDYETRFIVHGELVCGSCCVIKFPIPKTRTKGMDIRLSCDEDFADFLTFVQQDAYAFAEGMKEKMDYPRGTVEWLKYFGQPSEDDQVLDEEEIMRLKRKDERRERQRMLKKVVDAEMMQDEAMSMSDEQAIQILKPMRDMMRDQHGCPISDAYFAVDKAIHALQTISPDEAHSVVHCGECKFWRRPPSCEGLARCETGETGIRYRTKNDFCSRGAKMEVAE